MRSDVKVSLIKRERFDQRTEAIQNLPDDRGFAPVNVEARREDDEIRTTLQGHERRHGRVDAECARLIIARRQYAAALPHAANPDRFTAQRRPIAHFDRRVEAIHVEMDDGAS